MNTKLKNTIIILVAFLAGIAVVIIVTTITSTKETSEKVPEAVIQTGYDFSIRPSGSVGIYRSSKNFDTYSILSQPFQLNETHEITFDRKLNAWKSKEVVLTDENVLQANLVLNSTMPKKVTGYVQIDNQLKEYSGYQYEYDIDGGIEAQHLYTEIVESPDQSYIISITGSDQKSVEATSTTIYFYSIK